MTRAALLLLVLCAPACETSLDTAGLCDAEGMCSAEGYSDWPDPVETSGEIAGHGDTYRIIYVNPVARTYPHGGKYPVGSVMVKEIHEVDPYGEAGALKYIAIMRRVGDEPPASVPSDVVDDGWVFSKTNSPGGAEEHYPTCWSRCHRQAPYQGAWLDYGY